MTVTSIDIDPVLLKAAKAFLGAASNKETVERALQYTLSKEPQILAFERISKRAFTEDQLNAEKINY